MAYFLSIFIEFMLIIYANSVNPDQRLRSGASVQDHHCLPMSIFYWMPGIHGSDADIEAV